MDSDPVIRTMAELAGVFQHPVVVVSLIVMLGSFAFITYRERKNNSGLKLPKSILAHR